MNGAVPLTSGSGEVSAPRLSPEELDRVRGGGWDLPTLRRIVDQFVLHYDAAGTSRTCFRILHDVRGLSVHFMLDLDGTIYQTLDAKERAWHATTSNDRAFGCTAASWCADRGCHWRKRSHRRTPAIGVRSPVGQPPADET